MGLFGAALFFGDGMITPAISVLSAVEGLGVAAPALAFAVKPLAILVPDLSFFLANLAKIRHGSVAKTPLRIHVAERGQCHQLLRPTGEPGGGVWHPGRNVGARIFHEAPISPHFTGLDSRHLLEPASGTRCMRSRTGPLRFT